MKLSTEILSGLARLDEIAPHWEALVAEDRENLHGLDATNGPTWFTALASTFPAARGARIVVLRNHGEVVGLLPLIAEPGSIGCRRLTPVTSLYGGRNGLLLKHPDPVLLSALLLAAGQAFGPWRSIRMTFVDGSPDHRLLRAVCPGLGLRLIEESGSAAPFFPVLADEQQFKAGMSKGLKQTLRTATNKFRSLGALRAVAISDLSSADEALDTILEIDRLSWKQASGTAITSNPTQEGFYRAFFGPALRANLLFGQILYLGETPLAFNFGMLRSGVYTCLKHSQTAEHQALSPSQLLNASLVDRLRLHGAVLYDFMGKAEPHKLRWSDQTRSYETRPVWIYNRNACGRLGFAAHTMKRAARRLIASRAANNDGGTGATEPAGINHR